MYFLQPILSVISILFFFLPGLWLNLFLPPFSLQFSFIKHIFISIIITITLIPLTIFHLNHFLHLPISPLLIFTSITALNILSFLLYCRRQPPFSLWRSSIHRFLPSCHLNSNYLLLLATLIFGALFISYPLFFKHQPLPGPDSSAYLFNSSQIIRTGFVPKNLDRNIVFILPVIISQMISVSLETSLRLYILLIYILSGLSVYLIAQHFFSRHFSLAAIFMTYISYSVIRLSWHIYATFFAFLVLNTILILLLDFSKSKKQFFTLHLSFITFLWGCLFNLHGIVSFGSLLIVSLPLAYIFLLNRQQIFNSKTKSILHLFLFLTIFFFSSSPLIIKGWKFVHRGVIMPLLHIQPYTIPAPANQDPQATPKTIKPIETKIVSPKQHIEIPALRHYYLVHFSTPWIIAAIIGLIILLKQYCSTTSSTTRQQYTIFLLFSLGSFLLTQQQYIGIDWFSGRFVRGMYPVIIIFSLVTLQQLASLMHRYSHVKYYTKITTYLFILFISPQLLTSLIFIKDNYTSPIITSEYTFYKDLKYWLDDSQSTIYYAGHEEFWALGLNPDLNLIHIDNDHIYQLKPSEVTNNHRKIIESFSPQHSLDESLTTLSDQANTSNYYILIQTFNTNYDLSKFFNDYYQVIAQADTVYLLQRL